MTVDTFIYALCEPGTRTIRYIGKSDNPKRRLHSHKSESMRQNRHLGHWMKKINYLPELIILRKVPQNEWQWWEQSFITNARMLGFRLINATAGGDGTISPSPAVILKMRLAKLGKKLPLDQRRKMSLAHRGKKQTPEHVEKRICSHRGRKRPASTGEKIRLAAVERMRSPSVRADLSKRAKSQPRVNGRFS